MRADMEELAVSSVGVLLLDNFSRTPLVTRNSQMPCSPALSLRLKRVLRIAIDKPRDASMTDLPPEKWTPGYADFRSACSGVM